MNLIVSAYNHEAEQGNVVVIGADRPDGAILQDKGRLSMVLTKPGASAPKRSHDPSRSPRGAGYPR